MIGDPGYVVLLIIAVALASWMTRAQDDYLRAYNRATESDAPTSSHLVRLLLRPWRLWTSAPLTKYMRATTRRQSDADLEILRQRFLTSTAADFRRYLPRFFRLVIPPSVAPTSSCEGSSNLGGGGAPPYQGRK